MKFFIKFFVIFTIFISLIAYCSFSFATISPQDFAIDFSVLRSDLPIQNLYEYMSTNMGLSDSEILALDTALIGYKGNSGGDSSYDLYLCSSADSKFYFGGTENSYFKIKFIGEYYHFAFRFSDNAMAFAPDHITNSAGTFYVYQSGGKVISNYLYSNSSANELYDVNNTTYDIQSENVAFFNNAFNSAISNIDMLSVVNGMANELSLDNLYGIVQSAIPIIVIAVLFVLGYVVVRVIIKKVSKGKSAF